MAITIANLIAQVGADISQFRVGINEVEARMRLAEIRAGESEQRVRMMRERAAQATEAAELAREQRRRLRAERPGLTADVRAATADVAARERAAMAAERAIGVARSTGTTAAVDAAVRRFERETRAFTSAERRLRTAEQAVVANRDRFAAAGRRRDRFTTSAAELTRRAGTYDEERRASAEVARSYAARLAQNAQEHRVRAYNTVAATAEKAGVALGIGLAVATKAGSDFNQMMVTVGHNTSLSAEGIRVMDRAVREMGAESGANLDKLADGFRAVENRGYSATDAAKVLRPAMEAAVAKGSDLAATTTLLTNVMREFNVPVDKASDAMGMLVEISRRSGVTMEDMVHVFGQMTALTGNLGVSLAETGAAFIVFTRHGLNAAQAATQFRNDINRIISPTKKQRDAMAGILKETGVDLAKDFSPAGLRNKQPSGIWQDIVEAAKKYKGGVAPADLANKLFPNLRGQLGGVIATGTGFQEYAGVLARVKEASSSGANVNRLYEQSLAQVNQQVERLKNESILAASAVADALAPDIKAVVSEVIGLAKAFDGLDASTRKNIVQFAALAAGSLIIGGLLGKLIVGVGALDGALANMGLEGLGAVTRGVGPAVLGLTALAGVFAAVWWARDRIDKQEEEAAATHRRQVEAMAASTLAAYENGRTVVGLVAQYNRLHDNTHRTAAQSEQMQAVLNRLSSLAPELISGYRGTGDAIGLTGSAAHTAAEHLLELEAAARRARAATIDLQITQAQGAMQASRAAAEAAHWQLQTHMRFVPPAELGRGVGGFGAPPMTFRPATPEEIRTHAPGIVRQVPRPLWPGGPTIGGPRWLMPPLRSSPGEPVTRTETYRDAQGRIHTRMRRTGDVGPPQPLTVPPGSPEEARMAAELRDRLAQQGVDERRLQELAAQRVQAAQGPLAPELPHLDPNVGRGAFGADKTAGLGDAARKAKKEKEDEAARDARRLQDRYQSIMEGYLQSQFLATHEGKLGEAMWETQAHGAIVLADGVHNVTGEFAKYHDGLKRQLVDEARRVDVLQATQKWMELQKSTQLQMFEAGSNADGTERTPAQVAAKKAELGMYKEYGAHATDAMFLEIALGNAKERAKAEEQVKRFREEAMRPLDAELSVHDQMVKDIKAEAQAYMLLGAQGTERLAALAQENADRAEGMRLFREQTEKGAQAQKELQAEMDGDNSEVRRLQIALETEDAYKKLNQLQQLQLYMQAHEADAARRLLEVHKAQASVSAQLADQADQARIDVAGVSDPNQQKWLEFRKKSVESYGEAWKRMTASEHAAAERQIADTFTHISAMQSWERTLHAVHDTMDGVRDAVREATDTVRAQVGSVKVTEGQWRMLDNAQRDEIERARQRLDVLGEVQEGVQGLADLFGRTLDGIRKHGFARFFQDVIAGFDDMLFQMAKKWLQSQILQLLTRVAGGLFGGGGDSVEFDPGPAAVGARAFGGPVEAGASYLVGERGPELFTPSRSGSVTSNADMQRSIVVHVHGVQDANSFVASRHQVAQAVGRAVMAAERR